ncbi:hypothetical protein JKP88DRAFT_251434 [Tribonema minus]|uniref:Uncharacterized protein n=1 Tax=Tribonema minus TaxID=303371 RepID=A0A835ZD52_9STRA|nr:hypothetical protein JKP88DRAFT_251434 [Tribonema minus]
MSLLRHPSSRRASGVNNPYGSGTRPDEEAGHGHPLLYGVAPRAATKLRRRSYVPLVMAMTTIAFVVYSTVKVVSPMKGERQLEQVPFGGGVTQPLPGAGVQRVATERHLDSSEVAARAAATAAAVAMDGGGGGDGDADERMQRLNHRPPATSLVATPLTLHAFCSFDAACSTGTVHEWESGDRDHHRFVAAPADALSKLKVLEFTAMNPGALPPPVQLQNFVQLKTEVLEYTAMNPGALPPPVGLKRPARGPMMDRDGRTGLPLLKFPCSLSSDTFKVGPVATLLSKHAPANVEISVLPLHTVKPVMDRNGRTSLPVLKFPCSLSSDTFKPVNVLTPHAIATAAAALNAAYLPTPLPVQMSKDMTLFDLSVQRRVPVLTPHAFATAAALNTTCLPTPHFVHMSKDMTLFDLSMSEDMTLFFALAPGWIGRGPHAPGQRFFGTYPSGQLRLMDGHPAIKAESSEGAAAETLTANTLVTIAYRFSGAPQGGRAWASVNGKPWQDLGLEGEGPGFVEGGSVTVGGSEGGACGYYGGIGEVLAFRSALDEVDASRVMQYMARRWGSAQLSATPEELRAAVGAAEQESEGEQRLQAEAAQPAQRVQRREWELPVDAPLPPRTIVAARPLAPLPAHHQPAAAAPPRRDAAQQQQQGGAAAAATAAREQYQQQQCTATRCACVYAPCRCYEATNLASSDVLLLVRHALSSDDRGGGALDIRSIKKFDKGGSVLRALIHDEVMNLDILRNRLYC